MVSVIIPVYKVEKYLNRCVESIVNQTYKNLEIILVDDGSPDNCPKMCDEWAKKDNRIKVIHKQNGGVSSARNEGLKVANGEYIQFVDSDDEINLNLIERCIKEFNEQDVELVIFGYQQIAKSTIENICGEHKVIQINQSNEFVLAYQQRLLCCVWNKMFIKKFIDFEFDLSKNWGEDFEFVLKYLKTINKCSILNDILYKYYYLFNQNSLSSMSLAKKIMKMTDSVNDLMQITNSIWNSCDIKDVICSSYLDVLSSYLFDLNRGNKYHQIKKEMINILKNKNVYVLFDYVKCLNFNQKVLKFLLKHKMLYLLHIIIKWRSK